MEYVTDKALTRLNTFLFVFFWLLAVRRFVRILIGCCFLRFSGLLQLIYIYPLTFPVRVHVIHNWRCAASVSAVASPESQPRLVCACLACAPAAREHPIGIPKVLPPRKKKRKKKLSPCPWIRRWDGEGLSCADRGDGIPMTNNKT